MWVYGDSSRRCDPRVAWSALAERVAQLAAARPGLARHAALVAALIEAGELAQGLADAEAVPPALDARRASCTEAMRLVTALAADVAASWASGFRRAPAPLAVERLAALALPAAIACRRAEGFAYYAVYPEAYAAAAIAAVAAAPGPRVVIGIRSIGTTLAAVVAAAIDAPVPDTVRPRGHPFARRLAADPALVAAWTAGPDATVAIVDEGPGLSGSSFGAVLDAVEAGGARRVECYPSHRGALGPRASEAHRTRWRTVACRCVDADELLLAPADPAHALAGWIAGLVGPLRGPLEDLSGGAWRAHRPSAPGLAPAVIAAQERRKWLAHPAAGGAYVARFAGLGAHGEAAAGVARRLAAAGLTPPFAGTCHGFVVERWLDDAAPLDLAAVSRPHLVASIGRYLGFRARHLPAGADAGAPLEQLIEMARHNTALALGPDRDPIGAAAAGGETAALARRVHRVQIDGRLHAWEWLVDRTGALIKTDAIDHHAAHDLVGCQDLAWDLAGAEVELALAPAELREVAAIAGQIAGRPPDPALVALLRPCYLAFQLGRHALALDGAPPADATARGG